MARPTTARLRFICAYPLSGCESSQFRGHHYRCSRPLKKQEIVNQSSSAWPSQLLWFAVVLLVASVGCAGMPFALGADATVPNGTWGGEHASLTVTDAGAHAEFDCASGDIDQPLAVDAEGRLNVEGVV